VSPISCKPVVFRHENQLTSSVWDYSEKVARFVEVKGPGDSLSETQKVWIDVLLSAGIQVEVCKVKSKDLTAAEQKKRKRSGTAGSGKRGKSETGLEAFEDEKEEKEEGEFDYESGDEGKGEGRWEEG
jgi:Fanconi-associated nuclease 1